MTYRTALLLVAPVVLGMIVGYLLDGRLASVGTLRLHALWLLWLAAGVQACQYWVPAVRTFFEDWLHIPMLAVVFGAVAVWLTVNLVQAERRLRVALAAIALGAALNGIVVLANGLMPFSVAAANAAGLPPSTVTPKNRPADDDTRLAFLGDVVALPGLKKVLSPGDLFISLGAAGTIALAMRRRASNPITSNIEEVEVKS